MQKARRRRKKLVKASTLSNGHTIQVPTAQHVNNTPLQLQKYYLLPKETKNKHQNEYLNFITKHDKSAISAIKNEFKYISST
jgi:hypothetical protein